MFRSKSILLVVSVMFLTAGPGLAAKKAQRVYAGIMVGWDEVEKPNRIAGALRGAMLGAASTPPPASEPSGAGDGVSRTAQGTIAAQQAQEHMRYPTRWYTVYSFHSGYYVVSASIRSSKRPVVRTGDQVRFSVKDGSLFLNDGLGKTFKLKIVGVQRTSVPYVPAAGAGESFSPGAP